jgi:hypothetical protein
MPPAASGHRRSCRSPAWWNGYNHCRYYRSIKQSGVFELVGLGRTPTYGKPFPITAGTITDTTRTVITIMATGIVKLPDAEENQENSGGNKPRKHGPTRNGSGSPALYATQRVMSIPFRFVIEAARTIIRHE